jgi:hypothetical protein
VTQFSPVDPCLIVSPIFFGLADAPPTVDAFPT